MSSHFKAVIKDHSISISVLVLLTTMVAVPVFYVLIFDSFTQPTLLKLDYYGHIQLIRLAVRTGVWPSYPLFHVLVYFISAGSLQAWTLAISSITIVTLFVIFKALISYGLLYKHLQSRKLALGVALALLVVMPWFNWWGFNLYLGQIAPNLWHNPTTIVAMPFSILLFYVAIQSLETTRLLDYVVIAGLVVLNLLSKPNYLLAFLPVYYVVKLIHYVKKKDRKILFGLGIIGLVAVTVLLYQFSLTYGHSETQSSQIGFSLMGVWRAYSRNIVASFVLSTAFPLTYVIAYAPELKADKPLILAWAVFGVALAQYCFLAEKGPRFLHGNFGWASIISVYILFLTTAISFFKQRSSKRYAMTLISFALHLLTGAFYIAKILAGYGFL